MSEYGNIIEGSFSAGPERAVSEIEADPEKASRAVELSQATGTPASAIYGDVENFERQHKSMLAGEIVRNNAFISDYVTANQMNARISNDDYGSLDAVSQATQKLRGPSTLQAAVDGWKEGFGEGPVGSWMVKGPQDLEVIKNHRLLASVVSTVGSPVELALRTLGGAVHGIASGVRQLEINTGGNEAMAKRLERDVIAAADAILPEFMGVGAPRLAAINNVNRQLKATIDAATPYIRAGKEPPLGIDPNIDAAKIEQSKLDLDNLNEALKEAQASRTRERNPEIFASFIRQHTDAKIGISADALQKIYGDRIPDMTDPKLGWVPDIGKQYEAALATGGDVQIPMADWLARVDPEFAKELKDDIRVRPGGVTKNEVEALKAYEAAKSKGLEADNQNVPGDQLKPKPTPEELGPEEFGARMEKVLTEQPELRQVPFGVSDEFVKSLSYDDYVKMLEGERTLKVVRDSAGIDFTIRPAFGEEVKRLKLEAAPEIAEKFFGENLAEEIGQSQFFKMIDPEGLEHGFVELIDQGKNIAIQMIASGVSTGRLSPRVVRDLLTQLKEAFPNAESISGYRVSGARKEADTMGNVKIALAAIDPAEVMKLTNYLNDTRKEKWEDAGQGTEILVKPKEAYTANERQIEEAVYEVLNRIAPHSVSVHTVDRIRLQGDFGDVAGLFRSDRGLAQVIIPIAFGDQAPGFARHEAIHALKRLGLFTPAEWTALTDAAKAGGWIDTYNIRKQYEPFRKEYGDQFEEYLLEEAVAHAYHGWAAHKPVKELTTIAERAFEKLRRLVDELTTALEQIFGRKPTFEEVFERVEAGDVGSRMKQHDLEGGQAAAKADEPEPPKGVSDVKFVGYNKDGVAVFEKPNGRRAITDPKTGFASIESPGSAQGPGMTYVGRHERFEIVPESKPSKDQPELPGMTRMEDREAFEKASAIGMTVDQYKRYMKLIERRQAEDAAALEARALKDQKRRLTAEWKEAERDLRPQVLAEINNRPDVAADNFFREGLLYGNKVETTRLSSDHLTPEQIEALPKSYIRVNGIHPDDAASLFGYPNGAALVEALVGINEQRKTYGGRPEEFKRHLVSMELERQMQAKFGDLERNIIEEAKDQVLSQTQLDLLHEETMALGLKAGTEYSITKEQLRGWIGEQFNQTKMEFINSDKFLRDAGKAGRATEDFLLKEKFVDAFKEKQRQYIAVTMATEAKKIEKAKAQLDRVAKTYSRREVPSVEKDYTNYIQGLLQQAGYPIRLTPDEIHANIDASGYASMPDFIAEKQSFGWEPAVSEDIQHNGVKPIEQMTATEFREFKDAIDSLNYIGRQERKIEILGEKLDWEEYRKSVIDNVSQLPVRPRESQGRWLYEVDASLTRMEEIVKDLDLRQELGPIFNAVIEPMMASKAKSFDLLTDLSKFFRETKGEFGKAWRKTLNDTIPQDFLIDPYYRQPYDLTRENLIQIMLNWGNRSNIEKFSRGHASLELGRIATKEETAAFADRVKALIDQHATKEDWDFVQRMWEPFKKFQPMTDQVARNTSGVVPRWIQPEPVVTPHGTFEGGYWPVKYDRLGSDIEVIEDRKGSGDQLFGPSYFRAATAKGHLKERTGYVDFVDITTSIEQAAGVMQQTIHDIAYRDALMQASKVFYDKPIRAAIKKHYGKEYEAQLIPWLKRIANQYSVDERPIKGYNDWLRRARVNLIGHALPLNLKVIFSPDIGTLNPASWTRFEANRAFNTELALTKSNEIRHLVYNMDRDFREQLDQIVTKQTYSSLQTEAVRWGFKPMMKFSQEFRMATFVDQYNKAKARGLNDHEASVVADSYVRERHGAASVVDLPAIMANSESLKTLTMFYGFFNTMYNWQRQLPGNLRRQEYKDFMINGTGSVLVGAAFGAALFNQSKQDDSWWKIIAKALLIQPLSTVPVVRDIANFVAEGYHSRSPIASVAQAGLDIGKDIVRWMEKKPVKKPIQHAANVVGLSTGLPLMQPGKTSQFLWDVGQRKQQPRNILEWWRGIVTGEAKLKK